ncbi:MAG: 50S ribosomal protein L17 [Candidatus Kerfeldbacteria bacterium]|nr:50S ribosomal protein L17 [Candidatus Kerfeldbacteria bacterium]
MRHRKTQKKLDRNRAARVALVTQLVSELVLHGFIVTTLAKAKVARTTAERFVSRARTNTLATRRYLLSRLHQHEEPVNKLLTIWGPKYQSRPGGFTRITRITRRSGDRGESVKLEFVES